MFIGQSLLNQMHKLNENSNNQLSEDKNKAEGVNIEEEKKLSKDNSLSNGKNNLHVIYEQLKQKLSRIFSFYMRDKKVSTFGLDNQCNSMNLKTFASYWQYFKLSDFVKIGQISKYFKKYSENGTWLNQEQFLKVNLIMMNLPENINQQVEHLLHETKVPIEHDEQNNQEYFDEQSNDIVEKLNKLSQKLQKNEIKKLLRKQSRNLLKGNVQVAQSQRIKSIIQCHTGIYKKDIIQKLIQRKKEKEEKYELKMNKMLQKYKIQQNNGIISKKKINIKSSHSFPHSQPITIANQENELNYIKNHLNVGNSVTNSRQTSELKSIELMSYNGQGTENKEYDNVRNSLKQKYKQLSLPRLTKKKMRELSIYEQLKLIDAKNEFEAIKNLIDEDKQKYSKEDRAIFRQFFAKQKIIKNRDRSKKLPVQCRMKFT